MRNRWLLNLGLVAFVVVLALFTLSRRDTDQKPPDSPLTTLATNKISRVRIQFPGKELILLQKQDQTWLLKKPLRVRANQLKVQSLLGLATAASEIRLPISTSRSTKYGLNKPKAKVWLDDEQIQIGDRHPFKNSLYALYNHTVHLIPTYHFTPESFQFIDLISPRLLEEGRTPVAFDLPDLALRQQDGSWRLDPENKHITPDRINDFVNEWRYARAMVVSRDSGSTVRDRIRITFVGRDATEVTANDILELGILSYQPEFVLYRKDEGLEYHFPAETGRRLLNIISNPQDKRQGPA